MKILKVLLYICLSVVALFLLCAVGAWSWVRWEYHLPSEQHVRRQFESHRADYIRIVTLLQKDPSAKYINGDGKVDIDSIHSRFVPEYRDLIRKIGAKFVCVREDGSMEFTLGGYGGPISSDSYIGVRYFPKNPIGSPPGWTQTVVSSLDSTKLPQENGSVATGLYVVAIEPEWFIFRFEYQE